MLYSIEIFSELRRTIPQTSYPCQAKIPPIRPILTGYTVINALLFAFPIHLYIRAQGRNLYWLLYINIGISGANFSSINRPNYRFIEHDTCNSIKRAYLTNNQIFKQPRGEGCPRERVIGFIGLPA
jgi:hypothetical protein